MVRNASVTRKPIQVEIFPQKVLMPDTAEQLLNGIDKVPGVIRILIQGLSLPRQVTWGPGTGTPVNHPDRRIINVAGQAFELNIRVGRIQVEIEDRSVKDKIRKVAEDNLPFPFEFREGFFIRRKATLVDYAKYGFKSKEDESINLDDERLLGLVDPKANPKDRICMLESEDE
ncbi:MAG: methyl-coenzyme M reductase subunit D [Candidatus Methanocomedens sp.]|jgi:methyl-coenzyme M reductase subunit D|nr:MAG: methyl-coenzyme M reductase subunit D [ANME-2 cluster archaeon]MRG77247.1 methyl-coenzyme M reductase operon protein D [ANME-2 cluster archaeon]